MYHLPTDFVKAQPGCTEESAFMHNGNVAIIGGTGFEQLPPEIFAEPMTVETRFGAARVLSISNNYVEPYKLYFLSRHGETHGTAPHQINYAANIAALVALGVKYVFASNAVGSLRREMPPGTFLVFDDFLDFTRQRELTYSPEPGGWKHTDFSEPYSPLLRDCLIRAAGSLNIPVVSRGTYLCCDGPRFETPAEILLFAQWGADVVGMTGLPEAIFAREAGLEYAGLGIVTNLGAGMTDGVVSHTEVTEAMAERLPLVREWMLQACATLVEQLTQPEVS